MSTNTTTRRRSVLSNAFLDDAERALEAVEALPALERAVIDRHHAEHVGGPIWLCSDAICEAWDSVEGRLAK
ncbi:MAG: hypothetical protein GX440_03270 [Propionibacterium sp.]|nr:hypothetical protein [Propionibacterium sp.]